MAAVGLSGEIDDVCTRSGDPRPALLDNLVAAARSISRSMGHGQLQ